MDQTYSRLRATSRDVQSRGDQRHPAWVTREEHVTADITRRAGDVVLLSFPDQVSPVIACHLRRDLQPTQNDSARVIASSTLVASA